MVQISTSSSLEYDGCIVITVAGNSCITIHRHMGTLGLRRGDLIDWKKKMQRPKSLNGSKNQVAQDIWDKSSVQPRPWFKLSEGSQNEGFDRNWNSTVGSHCQ